MNSLPAWQPLTPESSSLRLESERVPGGLSGCVALAYVPWVGGGEWVAGFATSLARNVAERRGTCLIDGSISDGVLDGIARANGRIEGVTDAILFGASLGRVRQNLGGGLSFVGAGTPGAESSRVFSDPAWPALWSQLATGGLGLVVVPLTEAGASGVLDAADAVILARPDYETVEVPAGIAGKTVAVVGPPPVPQEWPETSWPEEGEDHPPEARPADGEVTTAGPVPPEREREGISELLPPVDLDLDAAEEDGDPAEVDAVGTEEGVPADSGTTPAPDAWTELGAAFSLRPDSPLVEGDVPDASRTADSMGAPPLDGLVDPHLDRLVKAGSRAESGETSESSLDERPAGVGAVGPTERTPTEVPDSPPTAARTAPRPSTRVRAEERPPLPIRRIVVLVLLLAVLFAVLMGWIEVPGLGALDDTHGPLAGAPGDPPSPMATE